MSEQAPTLTRQDLEAKIVKRCWQDEAFHQEFATDPVGTAVKYLGVPAAQLPNIVIHEEPAGSWHIVLPAKPRDAGELSEEDLEKVAGGATPVISLVVSVIASSLAIGGAGASAAVTIKRGW
jgi:hypothetical protein